MLIQSNNSCSIIKVVMVLLLLQVKLNDSLNTGYKNNQLMCVENVKLLKCSYLLYALNYMQIIRLEIDHPNFKLNNVLYPVSKFLFVLQKMICTLYAFEGVEIGSLWLVHIYLEIIRYQIDELKISFEYLDTYFKDSHDYVIDALKSEVSTMKCNAKKNQFYVHEEKLKQLENQPLKKIFKFMLGKTKIMHTFILKNTELSIIDYRKFTKKNILIKIIGSNSEKIIYFIDEYNVQVNWGPTNKSFIQKLQKKYENAHKIDWRENQLKFIQIYYDAVFSFFKIIMLRLTWKHILYVKKQKEESIEKNLIDTWLILLSDFTTFFHLKDDDFVYKVKKIIEIQRDVDDYLLKSYLNTLCWNLGCNALEEMVLDGKELPSIKNEKYRPVHNEIELETVQFYSLGVAGRFIINIKELFSDSDFNVVKSFIDFAESNQLFFQTEKKIEYYFSLYDIK